MWKLYDELIGKIPPDILVDRITIGLGWTVVSAGSYCGTAMTVKEHEAECGIGIPDARQGFTLKSLASLSKSWNFIEASVGVAAINAYYNNTDTWKKSCQAQDIPWKIISSENAFDSYSQLVRGKKTAVIGHFHKLEDYLKEAASISVLERKPTGNDFPDSACEYILPEQDFVFITGTTLINKTLPRLLTLAKNAHVVLVGPSTPMTPILFDHGADELSGFLVCDKDGLNDAATTAGHDTFFRCGERTRMIKRRTV